MRTRTVLLIGAAFGLVVGRTVIAVLEFRQAQRALDPQHP
jgi:hypothetical protein